MITATAQAFAKIAFLKITLAKLGGTNGKIYFHHNFIKRVWMTKDLRFGIFILAQFVSFPRQDEASAE